MYRLRHLLCVPIIAAVCMFAVSWAGTTGKVSGVITDAVTGESIPGVAVSLPGTSLGALTDADGRYVILNVPVGSHNVKASMIGLGPVTVSGVHVSVDLTTQQDFTLSTQAVPVDGIEVTAERPLVLQDRTATLRVVDAELIDHLPTRGYQEIVGLQAGAVRYGDNAGVRHRGRRENSPNGTLNIRGGRPSEVAYYVDGFSQQDPLTGLSTTRINNNAIKEVEVVSGGFNAEYGMVMSGAVNVTTREGRSGWHGTVEAVTDNFHGDRRDNNIYSVDLSGPLFPGNDKLTFYASGERRYAEDRDPRSRSNGILPGNSSGLWNWQGKMTWRPSGDITLRFGTIGSRELWQEYRHEYLFDSEHMPRYDDRNQSFSAELTHTVSPSTFYTLSGNWYGTERTRGDGVYFDDLWAYGRPNGNPGADQTQLFWSWDDMGANADSLDAGVAYPDYTEVMTDTMRVTLPDGSQELRTFVTGGDEGHLWPDLLKRQSSYVGGKFDLVSQVHPFHELKFGVDFQRHTLRRYRNLRPTLIYNGVNGGFDNIDYYGYDALGHVADDNGLNGAKHPVNISGYFQDKFEWDGLVVNAGLRLDYFDYKTERLIDQNNPLDPFDYKGLVENSPDMPTALADSLLMESDRLTVDDLEASEAFARFSPRLGIAFPTSDVSVMHMSYGKFYQRPDLQNLYVNYGFLEHMIQQGSFFYPFGNPNLEAEETTAYEFGWRRQVSDHSAVDVTAFYKDVRNLTQVATVATAPNAFSTYRNQDFGTIKGLELQFDMRRNHGIAANLSYTLSYAEGTGSYANSNEVVSEFSSTPPKMTQPLDFEQRHKFTAILDLRSGPDAGPTLGDFHPFENAGVNFVVTAGSGFPYTASELYNEVTLGVGSPQPNGTINAWRGPWNYQVDLKADRALSLAGADLDLYLWVINVFDRQNVIDVYEVSGMADNTGWLDTPGGQEFAVNNGEIHDASGLTGSEKYQVRQVDPRNYSTPRQIRFGARWSF